MQRLEENATVHTYPASHPLHGHSVYGSCPSHSHNTWSAFFSFAVEPVLISSLTDESQDIKLAFERLISSSRYPQVSCTEIVVAEEMKLLYNTVHLSLTL